MKADLVDPLAGRDRGPQELKPASLAGPNGTAEAVPYPKPIYETGSKDLRQQLGELLEGRICLMGLGNVEWGDDGFGVRLAEELLQANVPDVIVAGTTPEDYVGRIANQGFDRLVFLDAVEFEAPPGSVALLDAREIFARYPQISTHKISLGVLAKWIRGTSKTEVWLLGVQPQSIKLGPALTPTVRATLEVIRSLLLEVVQGKYHAETQDDGPIEQSSTCAPRENSRAALGRTAEGGCPYVEAVTA